jgi:hypothetical protein
MSNILFLGENGVEKGGDLQQATAKCAATANTLEKAVTELFAIGNVELTL